MFDGVLIGNDEHPTEPCTYRNYYNSLMTKLDIPKLKYHGLRHSFATRCIEAGCDYKTVSVLLGHSNVESQTPSLFWRRLAILSLCLSNSSSSALICRTVH